jgi:hypothetical protein
MNNKYQLIISLTTWKKRINDITLIENLTRLFLQKTSVKYKVVLVLSEEEFPNKEKELPYKLLLFKELENFEILWTYKNTKALKKLNPTMLKYPNLPIITLDDDILLEKYVIEDLYHLYLNYPQKIITGNKSTFYNFFINGSIECITGGIRLFPPNSLYPLDENIFEKYFSVVDDDFNSIRATLQGTKYLIYNKNFGNIYNGNMLNALYITYKPLLSKAKEIWNHFFNDYPDIKKLYDKNKMIRN